jgi:hypothetical protein
MIKVDVKGIASAVWNTITSNEKAKKLSIVRREICNNCAQNSRGANPRCLSCGCFIKLKTLSTSPTTDCPLKKWNCFADDREHYREVSRLLKVMHANIPKFYFWLITTRIGLGKYNKISRRIWRNTRVIAAYNPLRRHLEYLEQYRPELFKEIVSQIKHQNKYGWQFE